MDTGNSQKGRVWHILLLVFIALAAGIVMAGVFHYRNYERNFRAGVEHQLAAVAKLKVDELAQWRSERLNDAELLNNNPAFSDLVRRSLENPGDADSQRKLQTWMDKIRAGHGYARVFLADARGVLRMSAPEQSFMTIPHLAGNVADVLKSGRISFLDFHRDTPDGPIHLVTVVPIFDGPDGRRPLGAVALRIEPADYLYPFINRWPVPSSTAETLLIRREGDEALFLNELRFQKDTALRLRAKLGREDQPAVRAALGQEGIVEGRDYRGVPVFAYVLAVPGSPWFLVARMDQSEVFAPLHERLWMLILFIAALIAGSGAVVGLIWRRQSMAYYRQQLVEADKLRESEKRYRLISENSADVIWTMDINSGRFTYVSPSVKKLRGYTPEEVMAQDMSEVLTPEHLQSFAEGLPRLIAEFEAGGGVPLSRTDRVDQPCRDGSIVHTEAVTTLLPGNDGRAGEVLGVSRNITERIKAEEALISSEARLRNLLDESPYPLVVTDLPRGVVLFINQPGADLFEVDKQAVIGSETGPFYGKAGLRDLMVAILRRDGAIKDRELVMSTSKGRLFHAQVSVNVSQYEGQEAALISVTDITARKRAEEALRQSEEKFSGAFQTSPYAITITRPRDGKFIEVNDTFAGMTGYTREEALADSSIGLNLWVDEEDRSRVVSELQKGLPVNGREVRFRKKDGAILTCLFSAQVMHLDGEPCILSSINDITERKKAEVEKNRLTDQLQQAMKMEAVGRLAGGVAHDFNNLLTGITGNISVALMDLKPDDPLAETLADVNKAADSAASLTRQLLAFSRKQIIEPKVLNLNELVTNLHKMLIRLIGENIELKTLPAANLASVKADPAQVEQIVINLAVNARDAMPHGGALVIETANVELDAEYCRTHADVRPGKYVMLAVSDTGEGMSKEVKEHLFEPFFTTKPRGHGTGLGLATIYGAIKQSGGSIEVYSEAGKGTTFKVYLPMVVEKAEAAGRQRGISELPGGTETVLVVEDEEMVRQFAVKILSRLGYKVLHAPNGQTALQLAKGFKDRIDLLMTDVVMPGMNGRQLAEKLIILHPETTMLFTSGYTENIIVHQGVVEESLNFIGKPYSPQSIAKKIREVLDKKGQ